LAGLFFVCEWADQGWEKDKEAMKKPVPKDRPLLVGWNPAGIT
jgi:hypothetical protein